MPEFTHINAQNRGKMVDVGEKEVTERRATARATVLLNEATFEMVEGQKLKKGDVLGVAQVAGIMAAKNTWQQIPMCHPISLTGVDIHFYLEKPKIHIEATVSCVGKTGVEMEALSAVSTAALTIYDMCKALQKDILIQEIFLLEKTGGKSGDYKKEGSWQR